MKNSIKKKLMEELKDERLKGIISREGARTDVYEDTLKKNTTGVGHRITEDEKKSGKIYGYDYTKGLSEEAVIDILRKDVAKHDAETDKVLSTKGIDKKSLSESQLNALREMNFQLGSGTQSEFKKTLDYIKKGEYEKAAEEAKDSRWYKQTPNRVEEFGRRIIQRKQEQTREPAGMKSPVKEEEKKIEMNTLFKEKKPIGAVAEAFQGKEQITPGQPVETKEEEQEERQLEADARTSLIINNKEEIAQSVIDNPDMEDEQKKEALKYLQNDKEISKNVKQNVGLEERKEQGTSLSSQFKDALTYFAPQLIGGLVGGALEGSAGMVAGFEEGGKARDSYLEYKKNLAELQLKSRPAERAAKALQQSQYVTSDGIPAIFDPNGGGAYKTPDGKIVDPSKLRDSVSVRQEKSLEQAADRFELSKSKYGYQIKKDSQLSDAQDKRLYEFNQAQMAGGEINRLFKNAETGQIIGRVQKIKQLADMAPEVFTKLNASTEAMRLDYQKATSGLQVNEREMEVINNVLPSIEDGPRTFKAKLETFERLISTHKEAFLNAIKTGQPLKATVVDDIIQAGSQYSGQPGQAPVRNQPARQITEADIDKMSKEELKRFLEE